MKISFSFLAFLLFASCSNNSSTGTNNNNNSNTGSTINGAAYCPLGNSSTWTGHVTGVIAHLDQNGNVYERDQIDQDYNASLGNAVSRFGNNVYPVYAYDANGSKVNNGEPVAYTAINDSEVIAMNQITKDVATIFPKILNVGQTWIPAPLTIRINQATLVQHLTQYTTTGGTSYSDVIKVNAIYLDSTFDALTGGYSTMRKYSANADLYLANGIGLVEVDVNSYNYAEQYVGGGYSYGTGEEATGTVWRKN